MGHLRLTIGYLKATVVHIRVTLGHLKVTIGYFFLSAIIRQTQLFFSVFLFFGKNKANIAELHAKVRPTCYFLPLLNKSPVTGLRRGFPPFSK